jgi:hypothetical protein
MRHMRSLHQDVDLASQDTGRVTATRKLCLVSLNV